MVGLTQRKSKHKHRKGWWMYVLRRGGESQSCCSPHLVAVGPGIRSSSHSLQPHTQLQEAVAQGPQKDRHGLRQTLAWANHTHPSVIGWQCGHECLPADGHEKDAWAQPGCHVAAWHRMDGSLPRDLEPLVLLGSSPMVL